MMLQSVNQGQRTLRARRGRAGRVDHQQRVIVLTVEQNIHGLLIMFAAGIIPQI